MSTLTEEHHHQVVGLPKGLEALVPLLKEYLVYLDLNARAWSRGESQFTATFQGVESQVIWFLSKTFAKKISCFAGYLHMLVIGAKGLRQMTKTRWFVYDKKAGRLKYYRTEKEEQNMSEPVGDIDVSSATFRYDVGEDNSGEFTIW